METVHKSVLLKESIDSLNLKDECLVIDATFGGGGHSREILEKYPKSKVIAFDQDSGAWERSKHKFTGVEKRITFVNKNFRDLESSEKVDGIIFDLGLSSDQLENSGRGFSFLKDEPLLMTMKQNPGEEDTTAFEIVNSWEEKSIADIIYGYGEERFARRIAKKIVEARKKAHIENTFDLVEVIRSAVPNAYTKGKIHFATKTFQALRMAVNDELTTLEKGLSKGFDLLKPNGRMSVISFHSLEDRVVKNLFKKKVSDGFGVLVNKKPIVPTIDEIKTNKRSRSAKLRVIEKLN